MTNFDSITIDMLDTVTGGFHDPPVPVPSTSGTSTEGCGVGELHQRTLTDRLGDLAKQIAPWILMR